METYIITVKDNPKSVAAAERCAKSIPSFAPKIYFGITPKDDPLGILEKEGLPIDNFKTGQKFSYLKPTVSAFLSHYSLWKKSIEEKKEIQILEHDALALGPVPEFIPYDKVISLGRPSFGKFNTPSFLGVGPLTSKPYFPGAHAYRVKPVGAKILCEVAKKDAQATDVFLDVRRFSFLQEYYPWSFVAKDNFTTLQNETGCQAKHGYNENYEILSEKN